MAIIKQKTKDNPKLQSRVLADGRVSLYLEYYFGRVQWVDEEGNTKVKHDRKKEALNLYLIDKPRTPTERQKNKDTLKLAEEVRAEKEQQLKADTTGKRIKTNTKKTNLFDFLDSYADNYTKKDIRMIQGVIKRFRAYIALEYPLFANTLKPEQLTKEMAKGYASYLESRSKGEGAKSYFQRFKKMIKYAVEKDLILKNPCEGIVCKADEQALKKDILTMDEIGQLILTTYKEQNQEVRNAFIFCLYTGMRFCDIKDLKFKNIDYASNRLNFEQSKTKGHSANSTVIMKLNDSLINLIGKPPRIGGKEALIFNLPSHTMCLKALKRWTARADIDKHITWHCARHSFAVNILNNGANIKTLASLLGHSGLKNTEKYTRAVDSLKDEAIDSLPEFKI